MRIVLLGCPGAGKGTQSKMLCWKYGLEHLSTGDIFRAEMDKQSGLGRKVSDFVRRGMLVPDDLVVEVVAARLDALEGGWLLDGFPRTLYQAQELDKYLKSCGQKINLALYLSMSRQEVVRRLTGRRSCQKCGEVFNLVSRPPRQKDRCDACAGELIQREDDTEATVNKRLMIYEDITHPLTAYYRAEHDFHEIDGADSPEAVGKLLMEIIDRSEAKTGA